MMRRILWIVVFLLPVGSLYAQGNAENGKKLFVKNGCYQCHGYEAQGTNAGARLAPKPMALAAMISYVRRPAPGGMPVYSPKVMSDAELADVWAFLKAIPEAPAVSTIPILNGK
jgi:ubiquinol-cytochrome c reductase cytochrome c subunit